MPSHRQHSSPSRPLSGLPAPALGRGGRRCRLWQLLELAAGEPVVAHGYTAACHAATDVSAAPSWSPACIESAHGSNRKIGVNTVPWVGVNNILSVFFLLNMFV